MPTTYDAEDGIEYWHDTDAEQLGNVHLYGVVSGCEVTLDGADMTYDVAAGQILHNGALVSVSAQANAGTLVADGTNPRWAIIYLDSAGVEGIVLGTPAAVPSKPEVGDNVMIHAVLIAPGQTVASAATSSLAKRVRTHSLSGSGFKYATAAQSFIATATYTDVLATSGSLAFSVAANGTYRVKWRLHVTALGTAGSGGLKCQITGPAAPTNVLVQAFAPWVHTAGGADYSPMYATYGATAFSAAILNSNRVDTTATPGITTGEFIIEATIVNGANAGTVALQAAQNTAAGTTTITGADMTYEVLG